MNTHYCRAIDEVPSDFYDDFREWVARKGYEGFHVIGETDQVYFPHHVREFLQMIDRDVVEIVEDWGEVRNRLGFTD